MSSAKEDTLSPDELRKRLYQTFKSKGVLDTLKTQLRNQLIQELKHPPLTGSDPVPRPVPGKSEPLLVSACNSIVADHLRASGYEYTLSVFYPESGLCKDKVFTKEDLLSLLKMTGFLISLLTQLTHYYTQDMCHDADTQTISIATYGESLVEKMKMIDKEYENFSYSGDKWFPLQSKLATYRKELEAQMQAEMNTKMQNFKDVEIAKVRIEEKEKFHKEFDKLKKELERTYEMKAKTLVDREKNAIDRLQKQQEIEEKNVYMQRQSVLKEIESLRNRENEMRMRMEAFEKTCQIHEEKVKTTEELLRRRELAIKTMENTYDQRLKSELSKYQLELKEEFIKRSEKLTDSENRNKSKYFSKNFSKFKLLRERLDNMSDYHSLKREKSEQQGQLRLLKKQLEEAQEENRILHADLGKPSKEQLAFQMELRRLQSARQLDQEEFDNQKQVLQAQLQSEVERCAQLKAQLTECEEKAHWMNNHVEDIKVQLRQTHQADGPLRGPKLPWSDSPDSDMELVAEAKARIQELQKEAETLEEAYRNYQQRAVRTTISHMLPPRPLSPQQSHPSHQPDLPLRKQVSHHSHIQSPHKPKVSRKPNSPEPIQVLSYDTRNTLSPAHPRVTFSEDHNQPQSTVFTDHSPPPLSEPLFLRHGSLQNEISVPSKCLPSTPSSRKKVQKEMAKGTYKNTLSSENTSKYLDVPAPFTCQEINIEIFSCCQCSYSTCKRCCINGINDPQCKYISII
uniref:OFD1 centriole and centriolar satellite protein n=1 Tax=Mastacembelus armatus TaxID=205130 RepID=A0A7N8XGP8_9TELE